MDEISKIKADLDRAYQLWFVRREQLFDANDGVVACKLEYERVMDGALVAGEITGKNEDLRAAAARDRFAVEYGAVVLAEEAERKAKWRFEEAEKLIEWSRASLRLAELADRVNPATGVPEF